MLFLSGPFPSLNEVKWIVQSPYRQYPKIEVREKGRELRNCLYIYKTKNFRYRDDLSLLRTVFFVISV